MTICVTYFEEEREQKKKGVHHSVPLTTTRVRISQLVFSVVFCIIAISSPRLILISATDANIGEMVRQGEDRLWRWTQGTRKRQLETLFKTSPWENTVANTSTRRKSLQLLTSEYYLHTMNKRFIYVRLPPPPAVAQCTLPLPLLTPLVNMSLTIFFKCRWYLFYFFFFLLYPFAPSVFSFVFFLLLFSFFLVRLLQKAPPSWGAPKPWKAWPQLWVGNGFLRLGWWTRFWFSTRHSSKF